MSEWLENIKVGDEVAAHSTGMAGTRLDHVERLTKTQIILQRLGKYRRSDGRAIGSGGFHSGWLSEPTQEIRDEIEHRKLSNVLTHYKWHSLNLERLREISRIISLDNSGQ